MPRAIIAGNTGFIGRAIINSLKANHWSTVELGRKSGDITWDHVEKEGLPTHDVLINMCGENVLEPFAHLSANHTFRMRQSRANTSMKLSKALQEMEKKPDVYICGSAIGIYPRNSEEVFTEDTLLPDPGTDWIRRLCYSTESAANMLSEKHEVRTCILRLGVVIGKEAKSIRNMKLPFLLGVGGEIGSGKQAFPWIHVDDVCKIIDHCCANETLNGPINAVTFASDTNSTLTAAMASLLHRPSFFRTPAFIMKGVFGSHRAPLLLEGMKVAPQRLKNSNFKYRYSDLKSALHEALS